MKKLLWTLGGLGILAAGYALAQVPPGTIIVQPLTSTYSVNLNTTGPQSAVFRMEGGTFTCSGGTATVANANYKAGSNVILTLKTVGGTVAAPFVATVTAGTGFTVTCGGSDTSVYSYLILG